MGGSKKQTVGYKYMMGLHFGLCHGPVDALLELRGGDRRAWAGAVTESGRIAIDAPGLWGGEKKEGGIVGDLDVMMGEASQDPNDYLVSQLGDTMPAFRGILSLVFRKGMVGAMNPYPKPWKFKVRRILKGWHDNATWYPEKAVITLDFIEGAYTSVAKYKVEPPGSTADYSAPDYDDSSWAQGAGAFGSAVYGADAPPINTHIPYIFGRTIWLRTEFGAARSSIAVEVRHDDAPTLWWNGEQIPLTFVYGDEFNTGKSVGTIPYEKVKGRNIAVLRVRDTVSGAVCAALQLQSANVGNYGMNPAHIAYEALTNPDWGMGYPQAVLDLPSFAAAADVFYAEGLGLCGQWTRQDTIEGFIQDVMNHAGAVLAQDPRTGLFRLLPIRGGYDVATLPEFRRGLNVMAVESFERAAITETTNEFTVEYTDVSTGKKGSVTVQHLANIQAQGGVSPQSVRYPLIPTADLAQRLGARDLAAKSQPLCRVRLQVDRSAYGTLPGQVLRWSDSKLGIVDMPMRVLEVDYGNLTSGAIRLTLAEDVFGLPATTYMGQQESGWEEAPTTPQPSPQVAAFEVPYVGIHRAEGASAAAALAPSSGFLGMLAAKAPGLTYGFTLYASAGGAPYEQTGSGEWSSGGLLSAALGWSDTVVEVAAAYNLAALQPGDLAMLGDGPDAELVRIDAAGPGAGVLAIARGVGDTVPKPWPVGTRLWGIEDGVAVGVTEYADGEDVDARAVTVASGGEMAAPETAPGDTVAMASRAHRPYPPGKLRISDDVAADVAYPAECIGELTVTWAHRDRLLQADQLVDQDAGDIGPEPGTTYTVRCYIGGVLVDEQAGITGTSATVLPVASGPARIEVEAVRDDLASWQAAFAEFQYYTTAYSARIGDDGDTRITDDGDTRILE